MSRLLTFPCHSIWTDENQLTGSIPGELGGLTFLTTLSLSTWSGGSCWSYQWHDCSHFLAILLNRWKSTHGFHSEQTRRTDVVGCTVAQYVDFWVLLFVWMARLLTFPCHSIWTDDNQLTGSIASELGELSSLTTLWLSTCIGLSSCSYQWHDCSHFLAILFEQMQINSWVPFQANSENLVRWLHCGSVRGLVVLLVHTNVTLAHISLPFYLNSL
jgi:hypothetical protein